MATSIEKTYAIVIRYSRDDEEEMQETDLECTELRRKVKANISAVVPHSQGILSAHIVGSVTET